MFPLQEVRKNKVLDLRDIRNLWVWVFCKFPNVVHKQVTATLPAGAEVSILNIQDWRGLVVWEIFPGWHQHHYQVFTICDLDNSDSRVISITGHLTEPLNKSTLPTIPLARWCLGNRITGKVDTLLHLQCWDDRLIHWCIIW